MNVDGDYSKLRLFKAWKFWIHETSAQYKLCRKTFTASTMSHISSKKHSNAAGQSSRGGSSKGQMQLISYVWKKNWNAMEKLWKSYGISFLGICTNPERWFLSHFLFEFHFYQVFLLTSVRCAASAVSEHSLRYADTPGRPSMLPVCLTKPLCSPEQEEWWSAAYKFCTNTIKWAENSLLFLWYISR